MEKWAKVVERQFTEGKALLVTKCIQRCPTSLIIKAMKTFFFFFLMKTFKTLRFYFTYTGMTNTAQEDNTKYWQLTQVGISK